MLQQSIYVGQKNKARLCRSMNFLQKSGEDDTKTVNCKAIADLESEPLMNEAYVSMTSDWKYVNTEFFLNRWLHHYCRMEDNVIKEHLWVEVQDVEKIASRIEA